MAVVTSDALLSSVPARACLSPLLDLPLVHAPVQQLLDGAVGGVGLGGQGVVPRGREGEGANAVVLRGAGVRCLRCSGVGQQRCYAISPAQRR